MDGMKVRLSSLQDDPKGITRDGPAKKGQFDILCLAQRHITCFILDTFDALCNAKKIYEIPGFVLTKPSWDWDWVNYFRPGRDWQVT